MRLSVKIFKAGRLMLEWFRLSTLRLRYGRSGIPSDLLISGGVRLSVTDSGKIAFGKSCSLDRHCTLIVKNGELLVGSGSYVGIGAVICARDSINIGKGVLIAEYVTIRDQDHQFEGTPGTAESGFSTAPVVIGDNVWIGAKATITRGVTIGENSVIGANSVVTRDIPPNVVAAGVPARVIRDLTWEDALTGQSG